MAYDAAAAANGWGRRHLYKDEAWALHQAGYPCPTDMRVPGASGGQGAWQLSAGGVPVPPVPAGEQFRWAIAEVRAGLTPEQAAERRWRAEGNDAFWTAYFQRCHDEEVADRGNNGPVDGRRNSHGRRVPPPPVAKEVEYHILDPDSEEEEDDDEPLQRTLRQSRWWGDDAGAGPSDRRHDDDGAGDYSQAIAASLGFLNN